MTAEPPGAALPTARTLRPEEKQRWAGTHFHLFSLSLTSGPLVYAVMFQIQNSQLHLSFLMAPWSLVFLSTLATLPPSSAISFSIDLDREEGSLPSSTFPHKPHSLVDPAPTLSVEIEEQ